MQSLAISSEIYAHESGTESYEQTLRVLERAHPTIDPDSPVFDERVMWCVYERMKSLVRLGTPPARAVELAADSQFGG